MSTVSLAHAPMVNYEDNLSEHCFVHTVRVKKGDVFVLFRPIKTKVKRLFPIHINGNGTGGGQHDRMCTRLFQLQLARK